MVSKCANPECSAPFLYFHAGKLFRLEVATGVERRRNLGHDETAKKPLRHIEFYWLCDSCAERMTLSFEKGSGISVRPQVCEEPGRKAPKSAAAAAGVSVSVA